MTTPTSYRGFKVTRGDATGEQLAILLPTDYRVLHVASAADAATDWNVANPTHPTFYVHSETTPATDYVSIDHDATDGTINVASGNLKLAIAGTDVVTVSATGITNLDDNLIGIGTGDTARFSWDTTDANANSLLLQLPAGGATDVPVFTIGDTIESEDFGSYNGTVSTTVVIMGSTATATGPALDFRKSRGTNSAPTVVTSGDDVGSLNFFAAVAAQEWVQSARILAECTGTVATTRGPGVLTFQTATDAAPSVLTTAMTISAAQLVTVAAGLTVTTGNVALTAGSVTLGEATLPAGTVNYIGRDNTGDTTINALTGKTINLAINGSDIATLSATVLSFTGTIAATGARVTQSYHTNITSTNAVTVDSSETVKREIVGYAKSALDIVKKMDIITFKHEKWLDASDETKLGIRAESVGEPLALTQIDRDGGSYPGVNLYSLSALLAKAVQQLTAKVEALEAKGV